MLFECLQIECIAEPVCKASAIALKKPVYTARTHFASPQKSY